MRRMFSELFKYLIQVGAITGSLKFWLKYFPTRDCSMIRFSTLFCLMVFLRISLMFIIIIIFLLWLYLYIFWWTLKSLFEKYGWKLDVIFSVLIFLDFSVGLSKLCFTENKIVSKWYQLRLEITTQHIDLNFHPQLSCHWALMLICLHQVITPPEQDVNHSIAHCRAMIPLHLMLWRWLAYTAHSERSYFHL